MPSTRIRRFAEHGEVREFEKGRFEVLEIGGLTIGRATYEPGWKWSEHVGAASGGFYGRHRNVTKDNLGHV